MAISDPDPTLKAPESPPGAIGGPPAATRPQEDLSQDRMLALLPRDGQGRPLLGRLPLICRLGKGGMGAVYYSLHPRLKVEVAVKVLPFNLVEADPKLVERFASEARMAASLASDHIVRVLDVDEDHDTHFLVMEYVPGESGGAFLKRRKAEGRAALDEREALDLVTAATRGLAAAHTAGIIHRDIKPDNILIPRGDLRRAKLADLGLAKPEGPGQSVGTQSHIAMGTPGYMAPEQIEDARTAGPPADVFSMGATLYALLSGQAPFTGSSIGTILRDTAAKDPVPLPTSVSAGVRTIVETCLRKNPAQRFPNGVALLAALEGVAKGLPPTLVSIPAPAPARKRSRVWMAAIPVIVGVAVVMAMRWPRSEPSPVQPAPNPVVKDPVKVEDKDEEERARAFRDYFRGAETARSVAQAADSVPSWQAVVDACGKAAEKAKGRIEEDSVEEIRTLALQRREWAAARVAEAQADLKGAIEKAGNAEQILRSPELSAYKQALEKRLADADLKAERKRTFDEIAGRARAETDPAVGAALWKQAKDLADETADIAEVAGRLGALDRILKQKGVDQLYADAMKRGEQGLADKDAGAAEAGFGDALRIKEGDPAAGQGLAKARTLREDNEYALAMREARGHMDTEAWEKAKAAYERALAIKKGDAAATAGLEEIGMKSRPGRLTLALDEAKKVTVEFVLIKAGTFTMGDPAGERDETPHKVTITRDFWMMATEVTQKQWQTVMGANPSASRGDDLPVDSVSWDDCQAFVRKITSLLKDGRRAALPTEAEWEYACRAGSETSWHFGADVGRLGDYAWYLNNAKRQTQAVAQKKANDWGLHDMYGNVWEWCEDWYGEYGSGDQTDPAGPAKGTKRIERGGGVDFFGPNTRSAYRMKDEPGFKSKSTGCRLVIRK